MSDYAHWMEEAAHKLNMHDLIASTFARKGQFTAEGFVYVVAIRVALYVPVDTTDTSAAEALMALVHTKEVVVRRIDWGKLMRSLGATPVRWDGRSWR